MQQLLSLTFVKSLLSLLAAAVFIPLLTLSAQAQARPSPLQMREREMMDRERELRRAEQLIGQQKAATLNKSLLLQRQEDFRRLQIINNEMMTATMSAPEPDYKLISNTTSEIKKRASRLKESLALPKTEEADAKANQQTLVARANESVKERLIRLDELIMSFISNPIFRTPGAIDTKLSARAQRDLDRIIELSYSVKKDADKLNKAAR